jgi:hypothetical protein
MGHQNNKSGPPGEGDVVDGSAETEIDKPSLADHPERLLSRQEVAQRLNITVRMVKKLDRHELHPIIRRGKYFYKAAEVSLLLRGYSWPRAEHIAYPRRPRRDGQEAAAVFKLFERNLNLREIVVQAVVTPERVRRLYHEWNIPLDEGERLLQRVMRAPSASSERDHPASDPTDATRSDEFEALATAVQRLFDHDP